LPTLIELFACITIHSDRGVRFGLVAPNPRIEGIMVSAPPLIAWEYNHEIDEGSDEARIMEILKAPKNWVSVSQE